MTPPLYLGLPMWANQDWQGSLYPRHAKTDLLGDYAAVFSSVEGNTTFYSGAPKAETIASWARQAPPNFRFCLKLPARVTHEQRLTQLDDAWAFLDAFAPLHDRLGPTMVQLPRDFGPSELPKLEALLRQWPAHLPCAVEHHPIGVKSYQQLVQGPFCLAHAQQEKPKLPLHVLSTGKFPLIRFIGHIDKQINERYFAPWRRQLKLWINQGKTPFLFVHTADNRTSPEMARQLYQALGKDITLAPLSAFAGERQTTLF